MGIRTTHMLAPPPVDYGRAAAAVWRAKQQGQLPKLDGAIPCVDCGKPARDYDHRNYLEPLNVEPVCRSCNLRRGPGFPLLRATRFDSVRWECWRLLKSR